MKRKSVGNNRGSINLNDKLSIAMWISFIIFLLYPCVLLALSLLRRLIVILLDNDHLLNSIDIGSKIGSSRWKSVKEMVQIIWIISFISAVLLLIIKTYIFDSEPEYLYNNNRMNIVSRNSQKNKHG